MNNRKCKDGALTKFWVIIRNKLWIKRLWILFLFRSACNRIGQLLFHLFSIENRSLTSATSSWTSKFLVQMFLVAVVRFVYLPVFKPCKQRRNFASQSQCDRVNCWWLHKPRLHSPGANVYGHKSCSRQHRSSSAYRPTSLYSVAIEPKPEINKKRVKFP